MRGDLRPSLGDDSRGLDPARLTPIASLNRVRFVTLPSLALPPDMPGRTAFELLSAAALTQLALEYVGAFGLVSGQGAEAVTPLAWLDLALADGLHAARDAMDALARRFGERLGWLIVTLRRGDAASRAARPDWDDSYWRHWAGISTIYLGGGLAGGALGSGIATHAARTLAGAGMTDCVIKVAPWPALLPLIGAARAAPEGQTAVVLDFGHSFVKRACAQYEDGALTILQLFPSRPARWTEIALGAAPAPEDVRRLGEYLVATMVETWRAARLLTGAGAPTLVVSLASYLRDGQPLARQGGAYAALLTLSDHLADWLAERVSGAIGRPVGVRLLHDGTAAAYALAGEERAAAITLGTALGVGFPPAAEEVRPISPRFAVSEDGSA